MTQGLISKWQQARLLADQFIYDGPVLGNPRSERYRYRRNGVELADVVDSFLGRHQLLRDCRMLLEQIDGVEAFARWCQ